MFVWQSISLKTAFRHQWTRIDFLHLTDVGREVAEKIYERHCFFTEQLIAAGVDPRTAEADACRIEHNISMESFEKLRDYYSSQKGR